MYRSKATSISNKTFLLLMVSILIATTGLLATSSVSMAAGGGETPTLAVTLADDVNTGSLQPGEQHWYTFIPLEENGQPVEVTKSLTLIFTPDDGNTINFVTLEIFEEDQIQFFSGGDTSNMTNLGAGQIVSRDNNPETGERFWTGQVFSGQGYYIQVLNDSDFPIDYWLFNDDITSAPLGEPEAPAAPAPEVEPEVEAEAEEVAAPVLGTDPGNPAPLLPGITRGKVAPNSTYWYTFSFQDPTRRARFKPLDYNLFFTPDDGNRRHKVNFELFPYSEFEIWRRGDLGGLTNFGAGALVSRDGDYNTGERIWRGVVVMGDQYLMAVENGSDVEIEYWLYDKDIYNPELGPKAAPAPPRVFAAGAAPQTALPLKVGVNKGSLDPGEEEWLSFSITDFDNEDFEEMALTMVTTPDDGNRIRRMVFDVFTAGGVNGWSPGDNSQINNMGAGSVVYRDDSPVTGERFWSGWIIDNDHYYVQVRNGNEVPMDYWLFTGDVYRPELGEPTQPVVRAPAVPGTAPSAPIPLKVGVNQDSLGPKEERWFAFSRLDADKGSPVETAFTLLFVPDDGNLIRDVNFELFEANQLRDWAPDNRFTIQNFGKGSAVSRDQDPQTGELLWKGHVIAGDLYYMRVSNETNRDIDFWIFPDDVINVDLVE